MTIDEAIAHAREKVEKQRVDNDNCVYKSDHGCKGCADYYAKTCKECAIEHEQLAEWLEELKERREYAPDTNVGNKSEWIPVTEYLPERNKTVLCWVKSTTIASGETYIIGSCDNGFWFLQTYEIGHHHFPVKDYEVAAWMPLPEPYKQEGE